jgi:dienelactone hydrolase
MKERAVLFGATKSLSGVLTEPSGGAPGAPAALLLSAGYMHRVGPNRLYVAIARRLAAAGIPVLRFDHSGLGESAARHDGMPLKESVLAEGIEAMNFLAESGIANRFVPMGLCWGGENAQRLAHADPRVVAAALIDGFAYRTFGYHARKYARHALAAGSWRRLFARAGAVLRRRAAARHGAAFERNPGGVDFVREFPPRAAYLNEMRSILGRGVELSLIFTGGGMAEFYNHSRQFGEAFPELRAHPRIRLEFMKLADHTFTIRSQQEALLASLSAWVEERVLGRATTAVEVGADAAAS